MNKKYKWPCAAHMNRSMFLDDNARFLLREVKMFLKENGIIHKRFTIAGTYNFVVQFRKQEDLNYFMLVFPKDFYAVIYD